MYVHKLYLSAKRLNLDAYSPKDFIDYFFYFILYATNTNISSSDFH